MQGNPPEDKTEYNDNSKVQLSIVGDPVVTKSEVTFNPQNPVQWESLL